MGRRNTRDFASLAAISALLLETSLAPCIEGKSLLHTRETHRVCLWAKDRWITYILRLEYSLAGLDVQTKHITLAVLKTLFVEIPVECGNSISVGCFYSILLTYG